MKRPWLDALLTLASPAVLVTVALAEGSVPREAGACMVVGPDWQADTIGGGHLEFKACEHARAMLAASICRADDHDEAVAHTHTRLQRFPLGPTLGQCCGGAVTLAFEMVSPATLAGVRLLSRRLEAGLPSWRLTPLSPGFTAQPILCDEAGFVLAPTAELATSEPMSAAAAALAPLLSAPRCQVVEDSGGQRWLALPCLPPRCVLLLFGAGHVGAAIVDVLGRLPCSVTWVDEREHLRPARLPDNVIFEATDTPEALVANAPAGASFLVMTHSHPLDQRLAEAILKRSDAGWFGLIGSRTKRIQFERRLLARGIDVAALATMECPVGLPGITGKEPAVIAIAVVARLLQVWQTQQMVQPMAQGQALSDPQHARQSALVGSTLRDIKRRA